MVRTCDELTVVALDEIASASVETVTSVVISLFQIIIGLIDVTRVIDADVRIDTTPRYTLTKSMSVGRFRSLLARCRIALIAARPRET